MRTSDTGVVPVPSPARDLLQQLAGHFNGQGELLVKAHFARAMGSDFVAHVLEAAFRQLDRAPETAALIRNWPGDPASAALAMRLNAALHLLARRGAPAALGALYARLHDDFDSAIGEALAQKDAFIAEALRHPTQTNEVGRTGAIAAALMTAQMELGTMPFELLELGASCGLNLNLAHYAFDLGGVIAGTAGSAVKIAPEWRGAQLAATPIEVLSARGVDLHPLDPRDPLTIERQLAFVWADQQPRFQRLEDALEFAQNNPPQVDRANALTWLAAQLEKPQQDNVCRAIFHSMVLQYFASDDRQAVMEIIAQAGERATATRPLAWIGFEWSFSRDAVHLDLTTWPGGRTRHLATCDPYGAWIDWR
ncbi:MAG: DUF2332 family protein [Sphingobium sp.]|nr:DUF2332 family protein [Sphingobium sp.]